MGLTRNFWTFCKIFRIKNRFSKIWFVDFQWNFFCESISVNTTTLKYSGLIDFGDEKGLDDLPKAKCLKDKVIHGLVFLFQPLADSYTQPIVVFSSKGPDSSLT